MKSGRKRIAAWLLAILTVLSGVFVGGTQAKANEQENLLLYVVIVGTHTFVQAGPGNEYDTVDWAHVGTQVEYLGEEKNGYMKVRTENGVEGYINTDALKPYRNYLDEAYDQRYVVNCNTVSLREYPTTSSKVLCEIPVDAAVNCISTGHNGFFKVSYNGKTGYVLASYLTNWMDMKDDTIPMTVKCKSYLSFRRIPSSSGEELAQIKPGSVVLFMNTADNGYYTVIYGNTVGYCHSDYLIPTYGAQPVAWVERPLIVYNCEDASFREGPDKNAKLIDCLVAGTVVSNLSERKNGYVKVRYPGEGEGWIHGNYLCDIFARGSADGTYQPVSTSSSSSSSSTASSGSSSSAAETIAPDEIVEGAPTYMAKVINCNEWVSLRKTPSTSAEVLAQVPLGQEVIYYTPEDAQFTRVKYLGKIGYILTSYLSEPYFHGGESRTVVNCKEWVTLRENPSTSAQEICKVSLGEIVKYNGDAGNGFSLVTYKGKQGYILSDYLK